MFQEIRKNSRVDESFNTMESETIQKNGASPKSHTSRRNFRALFLLSTLFVLSVAGFTFFSCDDEDENGGEGTGTLSAPSNIYASQSGSLVSISWNSVSGATYYEVYRSSNSNPNSSYAKISNEEENYAEDWSPLNGENYYKIRAVKETGSSEIRSDYSTYAYVKFSSGNGGDEISSLSPPTNVSASQSGSSVSISWNSVSGATQYFVYRSSSATGSYSSLTSVSGTVTTDNSPLNGYNYYKVKASNGSTTSDFSSYAYVNYTSGGENTTTKPDAPTGVTVSNEGNSYIPMITIRWNSVSDATSYKVYRSTSANGSYSQIGTSTTYTVSTDDNPREGTSYYKVKAVNSAGESDFSAYASLTYKANDVSPCPVTYGNCTVSGTSITMRWTVPTTSGCGTPTKAYLRVKHPDNSNYADLQTLSGSATSVSFTYTPWVTSEGYVYVGIITENDKGTSGGIPKVYDTKNKQWIN
ncbi:MAG: fibronectin type III domain-containing protein [Bacteroidales bacterium]|jgi:fibronectin type 3 domain-containing protein|nr:fibronectin type III domain-containing protein [Bacteroidales bacterium]